MVFSIKPHSYIATVRSSEAASAAATVAATT